MGDHIGNDEGVGGVFPSDFLEYYRENSSVHLAGGLRKAPNRRDHKSGGSMTNSGIFMEAAGNRYGVHCDMPDLRVVYWGGAYVRDQLETEVLGVGPPQGLGGGLILKRGAG